MPSMDKRPSTDFQCFKIFHRHFVDKIAFTILLSLGCHICLENHSQFFHRPFKHGIPSTSLQLIKKMSTRLLWIEWFKQSFYRQDTIHRTSLGRSSKSLLQLKDLSQAMYAQKGLSRPSMARRSFTGFQSTEYLPQAFYRQKTTYRSSFGRSFTSLLRTEYHPQAFYGQKTFHKPYMRKW